MPELGTVIIQDDQTEEQLDIEETEDLSDDEEPTDEESEAEESDEQSEDEGEESGDESEEYEDEAEYFKGLGLPENIRSVDDLVKAYQSVLPEMKRTQSADQRLKQLDTILKAQGYENGVSSFIAGDAIQQKPVAGQTKPNQSGAFFPEKPFKSVLKDWQSKGMFGNDQENAAAYEGVAKLADEALAPVIERAEFMATFINNMASQMQDIRWDTWSNDRKDSIKKEELFGVMNKFPMLRTLDEALNFMAISNPDLIKDIAAKATDKGRKQGQKKLKRWKGLRRGGENKGGKYNYKKYQNPDGSWNDAKLDVLPDHGVKLLSAWEKEFSR